MNNRENFDMDVTPNQNNRNNNKRSNNRNTVLVIFILVLLMVVAILVYFVYIQPKSIKKTTIVVEKTENIETPPEESNLGVLPKSTDTVDDKTVNKFQENEVKPVVETTNSTSVARDLSQAKNDKLMEGAVKFQDHIVMEGESLQSVAQLYGLKVQTIISVNSIKNIAGVTTGTILSIPDRNGQYYIVKKGDMLSTIAGDYSPTLGWKTLQDLNGLSDTKLDVGDKIFIPDMSEINIHPAMSKAVTKFIKPLESKIIARYGQAIENNLYDDGINIDGILLSGAGAIKASSDGKVLDSGVENSISFLIIAHKESYETIYKNIKNVTVKVGDEVKSGDKIGEVSLVDGFKNPVLYFSIRQSGIPLDPESFF